MTYRERNGMPRGRLIFICTWLGIFAVTFLIWAVFLGGINKDLAKYEGYQPVYAADEVFREYFVDAQAADLIQYAQLDLSDYDTDEAALECLDNLISGKELSYSEKNAEGEEVRYAVLSSGASFAEFSLVPNEDSKEIFGAHGYKLGEIKVYIEPSFNAIIFAPKGAIVNVNGKVLGAEYRVGEYRELADAVYFPDDDPDARFMAEYHVEGLFAAPSVIVTNAAGNIVYGVEFNKTSGVYDTEYSYRTILSEIFNGTYVEPEFPVIPPQTGEAEIDKAYADFLNEAMSIHEKFIHLSPEDSVKSTWRVLSFFKPGTEIYSLLSGYYNDSKFFPDNYEFSDIKIGNFAWLNEERTEFTCLYEMDSVMWISGNDVKSEEKVAYILTVDVSGEKYLISSLTKK